MSATATDITMSEMTPSPSAADVDAAPTVAEASLHEQIIQPTRGWIGVNWKELLDGRELLYFLIWRDLKVRYKQAILGVGWVVVQPIMNMILYTLVFGGAAGLSERLKPNQNDYAIFVYAGLLPWALFAQALSSGGLSLVSQQNIVKKIYFPRLYIPSGVVGGSLVDLAISFAIVACMAAWKHVGISPMILFLPVLIFILMLNALGIAYLMSALTVRYRDFRFLIPFMSQVLMFASFVAFPPNIMGTSKWRYAVLLNPMYGVVSGFRKCLLPHLSDTQIGFGWIYILSSLVGGVLLFFVGIFVFRRTERNFADIA